MYLKLYLEFDNNIYSQKTLDTAVYILRWCLIGYGGPIQHILTTVYRKKYHCTLYGCIFVYGSLYDVFDLYLKYQRNKHCNANVQYVRPCRNYQTMSISNAIERKSQSNQSNAIEPIERNRIIAIRLSNAIEQVISGYSPFSLTWLMTFNKHSISIVFDG